MTIITRQQHMSLPYVDDKATAMQRHRAYYAQLVASTHPRRVAGLIGAERLLASTDEHLTDIPLNEWDRVARSLTLPPGAFDRLGDCATLAGLVCVAKEAARQYIETHRA